MTTDDLSSETNFSPFGNGGKKRKRMMVRSGISCNTKVLSLHPFTNVCRTTSISITMVSIDECLSTYGNVFSVVYLFKNENYCHLSVRMVGQDKLLEKTNV